MLQRRQQRLVVEQARRQPQHGIPCVFAIGTLRQHEPLVQRLLRLAGPFGHGGQTLAPLHVVRCLTHRRGGHALCVVELTVADKGFVTQRVDLVVEGQVGARAGGDAPRLRVEAGLREHGAAQLLLQRQLQHLLRVAGGRVRTVGGARQLDQVVEHLGVVRQFADLALCGVERKIQQIA